MAKAKIITLDDKVTREKLVRMLEDYRVCFESYKSKGEGADCNKCCLGNEVSLKIQMTGEADTTGAFIFDSIRVDVSPCLLLPEIAARIKMPKKR